MTKHRIDIVGNVCGLLRVVSERPSIVSNNRKFAAWLCQCECGNFVVRRTSGLRSGGSTNVLVTYNGTTATISEWATKQNISFHTLTKRLNSGWSVSRALLEPIQINKRNKRCL